MKRYLIALAICVASVQVSVADDIKYFNADTLPLLGKAIDDTASHYRYARLPDSLETKVERNRLFTLGMNSTGMAVRFRSASPVIMAKWKSPWKFLLEIQTPVGTRGMDLYTLADDGHTWQFVNSAQPNVWSDQSEAKIIGNMEPRMREYMLYLSLYDTVDSLYIGVDKNYTVEQPQVQLPSTSKPIVIYGTSIVQGPGASRPSMNYSNMLSRMLNREIINLGFGGHGQLDLELARVIASKPDLGMVVLDFVPNCTVERIDTMMVPFFNIIRESHPDVPVLFIESPYFTRYAYDKVLSADFDDKNAILRKRYNELKHSGVKNIYFIEGSKIFTPEMEYTVDGLHLTDEGYRRFAKVLYPILKKRALK